MKLSRKTSLTLSDDEVAILDATARRLGISRSEVMRHLIVYQGLCGGDFPLTAKIMELPEAVRDKLVGEIRERAESQDPPRPQSFRAWVKETIGSSAPEDVERGAGMLLQRLLAGG